MITEKIDKKTKYISGFTRENELHKITLLNQPNHSVDEIQGTIIHELTHTIDGESHIYSNHPEFIKAYESDKNRLDNISILEEKDRYISEYSFIFTSNALNGRKGKNRPYFEDFADVLFSISQIMKILLGNFPKKQNLLIIYFIYITNNGVILCQ